MKRISLSFGRVPVALVVLAVVLCAPALAVANGNGAEGEGQRSIGLLPGAPKRHVSLHRRSANPFGSHYFQSWSAIPLDRGEGLYRNTALARTPVETVRLDRLRFLNLLHNHPTLALLLIGQQHERLREQRTSGTCCY